MTFAIDAFVIADGLAREVVVNFDAWVVTLLVVTDVIVLLEFESLILHMNEFVVLISVSVSVRNISILNEITHLLIEHHSVR